MEKDIVLLKKKIYKEENHERKNNLVIVRLKNDAKVQDNVKQVLTKLNVRVDNYKIEVQPMAESDKPVIITIFPNEQLPNQV